MVSVAIAHRASVYDSGIIGCSVFFFKFIYFSSLFLAVLGPIAASRLSPAAVRGPPTAVAPPAVEHGLQVRGFSSCGMRAQ